MSAAAEVDGGTPLRGWLACQTGGVSCVQTALGLAAYVIILSFAVVGIFFVFCVWRFQPKDSKQAEVPTRSEKVETSGASKSVRTSAASAPAVRSEGLALKRKPARSHNSTWSPVNIAEAQDQNSAHHSNNQSPPMSPVHACDAKGLSLKRRSGRSHNTTWSPSEVTQAKAANGSQDGNGQLSPVEGLLRRKSSGGGERPGGLSSTEGPSQRAWTQSTESTLDRRRSTNNDGPDRRRSTSPVGMRRQRSREQLSSGSRYYGEVVRRAELELRRSSVSPDMRTDMRTRSSDEGSQAVGDLRGESADDMVKGITWSMEDLRGSSSAIRRASSTARINSGPPSMSGRQPSLTEEGLGDTSSSPKVSALLLKREISDSAARCRGKSPDRAGKGGKDGGREGRGQVGKEASREAVGGRRTSSPERTKVSSGSRFYGDLVRRTIESTGVDGGTP